MLDIKYCVKCGRSMPEGADFCPGCGALCAVEDRSQPSNQYGNQYSNPYQNQYGNQYGYQYSNPYQNQYDVRYQPQNPAPYGYCPSKPNRNESLVTVVKVFMILSCVVLGCFLFPLAWCIPMTVSVFGKFNSGEPISTGMKVCVLLFVNLIAGICLLCMDD